MLSNRTLRIGAGCSVDITLSLPQMVRRGRLDYLIIDFMYEGGVAMMALDRAADPEQGGFARAFAGPELAAELPQILADGVRVVTNAGGLNPLACAEAVRALAAELGLAPKIAVVHGDDVLEQGRALQRAGGRDMYFDQPLPPDLISASAYLGAAPVAAALAKGADIVITGRVVDSALILGPLIHGFGWSMDDYDRLAAGTVIGHLLECGAQPSGGIFTDWREIDWSDSSFPIAECRDDGSAVLTKVEGTGGQVSIGTVSEQILYEIGDPRRYLMPDVVCDLSQARLEPIGPDRVQLRGVRGYPPTSTYKVCAMRADGWRGVAVGVVSGPDCAEKARRIGEAVLTRARRLLRERNLGDFTATAVELIGSGASAGSHAPPADPREMVYRIVVSHPEKAGAELMIKVSHAAGASMAPGGTGAIAATTTPRARMSTFLLDKAATTAKVTFEGRTETVAVPTAGGFDPARTSPAEPVPQPARMVGAGAIPLVRLAWTRSGDKGELSNVGVIARRPEFLPYLAAALTEEAVAAWYAHVFTASGAPRVERFYLPGLNALNFLLYDALAGGAVSSLRFDPMGKGLGQQLLDFPVPAPAGLAA